jgi:hypothetical protein
MSDGTTANLRRNVVSLWTPNLSLQVSTTRDTAWALRCARAYIDQALIDVERDCDDAASIGVEMHRS